MLAIAATAPGQRLAMNQLSSSLMQAYRNPIEVMYTHSSHETLFGFCLMLVQNQ